MVIDETESIYIHAMYIYIYTKIEFIYKTEVYI